MFPSLFSRFFTTAHRPITTIVAALVIGGTLHAQTKAIEQTVSTSSTKGITWADAIWGTPAAYATTSNDYVSNGRNVTELRTGGIFNGTSLTLQNKARLILKKNASAHVILEGNSYLMAGANTTIGGTLKVNTGEIGAIQTSSKYGVTIRSLISGAGTIVIREDDGRAKQDVQLANPANTFNGNWIIESTALTLLADNTMGTANLVLTGGNINTRGHSQTLGTFTLSADATIDLGKNKDRSTLIFANSSSTIWNASARLSIINVTEGTDSIRFGTTQNGLTLSQLGQITLNGHLAGIDAQGHLMATALPAAR